jgi:hypothetical protein
MVTGMVPYHMVWYHLPTIHATIAYRSFTVGTEPIIMSSVTKKVRHIVSLSLLLVRSESERIFCKQRRRQDLSLLVNLLYGEADNL